MTARPAPGSRIVRLAARPARRGDPLVRGRGLADRDLERLRERHHRQLHDPRPVHVRARRAAAVLLLVPRSCRTPTRLPSARPRPTSTRFATGRSTRASATSRRRPRATPSTRTASSSASASPTSARATSSCGSRRPSRAAPRPRPASTAVTTSSSVNGKPVADLIRTRRDRDDLRPGAGRRHRRDRVARPGRAEQRATLAKRLVTIPTVSQTAVRHPVRLLPRRLHPLPQLRAALGRGAQHRLPAAAGPGRDRARARRALQRRRARLGGAAPGGPDRRRAARGPGVRPVHPQRQAGEPQHRLPLRERSLRRWRSAAWW